MHIIIPARYHSTRFPGKLLEPLRGISVIERVYRQALLANAQSVIIATDHESIAQHAKQFGAKVIMTLPTHQTGTDRIAEVVSKGDFASDDIIVNVQGDEPFISPLLIQQVAASLAKSDASMATLCWPVVNLETLNNPNVVKVVRNKNNEALYFSRSPVPVSRDDHSSFSGTYKHIGLYAYRASFLLDYVRWPVCDMEQRESLEQLRVLWNGHKIKVDEACIEPSMDINTREDLVKAEAV